MKKLFTLIVFAIFFSGAVVAQNAYIDHTNQLNVFAHAVFQKHDGCMVTQAWIQTAEKVWFQTNGGGKPTSGPFSYLQYAIFDECTGDLYGLAEGFGDNGDAPSNNLMSCNMDQTFDVYDYGGGYSYPAHVQLEWEGYGKMDNWTQNTHYNFITVKFYFNNHGVARAANVTGTLNLAGGSYNYLEGLDLVEGFLIRGGGSTNIQAQHALRSKHIVKGGAVTERENEMVMYPNPATNNLFLKNVTAKEVRIINTMGAVVGQSNIESSVVALDISTLPVGTYFLQLGSGDNKVVKTFVKQ